MAKTKLKRPASPTRQQQEKRPRLTPQDDQVEDDIEDADQNDDLSQDDDGESDPGGTPADGMQYGTPQEVLSRVLKHFNLREKRAKELKEFEEEAERSRNRFLGLMRKRQAEISTMQIDYREMVVSVFCATTIPADACPEKIRLDITPGANDLQSRFDHVMKNSKDLLNSFNSFLAKVTNVQSECAMPLKKEWDENGAKVVAILGAGSIRARIKVEGCLRRHGELKPRFVDSTHLEESDIVFNLARQEEQDVDADTTLTEGQFVTKILTFAEKATEVLSKPEPSDD